MTKKEQGFKWQYDRASARDIYEAYARPSYRKVNAFRHCIEAAYLLNGYDCRIPSANCNFFTFAFRYKDAEGKERMQYHTYANTYDFAID